MRDTEPPARITHMWDSIFVKGAQVDTRMHRIEVDARDAGITTLAEYHAFRRNYTR